MKRKKCFLHTDPQTWNPNPQLGRKKINVCSNAPALEEREREITFLIISFRTDCIYKNGSCDQERKKYRILEQALIESSRIFEIYFIKFCFPSHEHNKFWVSIQYIHHVYNFMSSFY